jgi:hypothetical protein
MTWQDIARAVVEANPGAGPEVVAAAVSKAMPLMQADSQAQWRLIQQELAQQRITNQATGLQQRESDFQQREGRYRDAMDESRRHHEQTENIQQARLALQQDAQVQRAERDAETARARATGLEQKDRAASLNEWKAKAAALDRMQRAKINAMSNLTGPEKKQMLDEINRTYYENQTAFDELQRSGGTPTRAPSATPGTDRGLPQRALTPEALAGAATSGGRGQPVPPDQAQQFKQWWTEHPDQKAKDLQDLKTRGFNVEGL